MAKKKNWMKKAVPESHHGKFTEKAERAGKGVQEYAHEKADAPGALGKEARIAETFAKEAHKKGSKEHRRAAMYDHKKG